MEVSVIKKFIKDIFNKGNFKDFFKRNKVFLSVSIIVLILSVYSGLTDYQSYTALNQYAISELLIIDSHSVDFISSFISSFTALLLNYLYIIVMGLTFSVMAMLSFVAGNVSIGFLFKQDVLSITMTLQLIFMLLASIFAMCGAFLVTKMEVRFIGYIYDSKKNPIKRLKAPLKDLILSSVIMILFIVLSSLFAAI